MKNFLAATMSAALLAGLAGSVIAYRSASASADPVSPPTQTSSTLPAPAPVVDAPVVRRWAPCAAPATLEKGACVTDIVRTVILPGESPNAGAGQVAAAAPAPTKSATGTAGQVESDDGDKDGGDPQDDQQADHEDEGDEDDGDEVDGEDHHEDHHEDEDDGEDD